MKKKPEFVVFSGFNNRAVIAFCRAATQHGVPFHIVARCGQDPIFNTIYSSKIVFHRNTDELSKQIIQDVITAIRKQGVESKLFYVPSTEYLNRYVLAHRKECQEVGLEINLVEQHLYEKLSDKGSFYSLCESAGLPIPKQTSNSFCIDFPCMAKPKAYFGYADKVHSKPVFLGDRKMMEKFQMNHLHGDFVFQEYVQGESFYLQFYCPKSGEIVSTSQRNLIQQHDGGSIIAAIPADLHREQIGLDYINLLKSISYHGFVMIELRERGGEYLMIEANPRMWGPIQLTLDASAGLFEAYFRDHEYHEVVSKKAGVSDARYFWMGGLLESAHAGRDCTFHAFSTAALCQSFDKWLSSDVWKRSDSMGVFISEINKNEQRKH
jgi:predicted ATP-grasp superfamily ATP-dependent carboligase